MKLSKKRLKKIIREEMEQKLDNQDDEVEDIKRKVHNLWEKFQVFYTREAEGGFQEIAGMTDRLQLPLDQQSNLKKKIMELKVEFGELIEKINRYKSFVEEISQSSEDPDYSDVENNVVDGYNVNADEGGDYYAT